MRNSKAAVAFSVSAVLWSSSSHAQVDTDEPGRTGWSIAAAAIGSPLGTVNASQDDGFYDAPSSVLSFGGQLGIGYSVSQAVRLSLLGAFAHATEPDGDVRVNTFVLPIEGAFRVARWDELALWIPLRIGYFQAWHHGQSDAIAPDGALHATGGSFSPGLQGQYWLSRAFALELGVLGRLDVGTFRNGDDRVRGATALHSSVVLEVGGRVTL